MPELPEVETIRRGLESKVLNKKIKALRIAKQNMVYPSAAKLKRVLQGAKFQKIDRIGKLIMFALDDGQHWLLVHLKMTGQLIYRHGQDTVAGGHPMPWLAELPNKYSHVIFEFSSGAKLFFNDMRQFGYAKLATRAQKEDAVAKYGIEPLTKDFTLARFREIFGNRQTILKALLLNQQVISGLGNIYADEICWQAKVRPDRRVNTLTPVEIKNLFTATQSIIRRAIKAGGTTFGDYRDAQGKAGNFVKQLQVYSRKGDTCSRCRQGKITKIILVGRGTHFCPNCQK